ncbi:MULTISPECIES: VOC family protein [unclassified Sphingobacterium]|uniref:VOC family protein n=1 Tax=unclassified Sphingobacterium TaxID=2609468 RepID=UPI0025E28584|nr:MULTISPECIES: VOC family protein [unclassified Sphingobacterium]
MKIEHLALWVADLERMKDFYIEYFAAVAEEKYINEKKQYKAYFLQFSEGGTRLELMNRPDIFPAQYRGIMEGLTHFAITVGSKEDVDSMTERLRRDGFTIYSEPRTTGDGYYESVVLDPEGNHLELIAA